MILICSLLLYMLQSLSLSALVVGQPQPQCYNSRWLLARALGSGLWMGSSLLAPVLLMSFPAFSNFASEKEDSVLFSRGSMVYNYRQAVLC